MRKVGTVAALLASASGVLAQDLVFSGSDFESWDGPEGLVTVQSDGIEVTRFGRSFNAVANASDFSSIVIGDLYGSVRPVRTPSNQADAHLVADQDPNTWWQPVADDATEKFWVELDLGRAVIADKIRVIFPDTTDARPFTFFSVFTSPGIGVTFGGGNRIVFTRVGRPINNNTSSMVEFELEMDKNPEQKFSPVRFVRFEAVAARPTRRWQRSKSMGSASTWPPGSRSSAGKSVEMRGGEVGPGLRILVSALIVHVAKAVVPKR